MRACSELPGSVSVGGFRASRLGLSTGRLQVTGMWGEPGRRSVAVGTIERAVQLGVQLIEVPAPFGPWADLVREAASDPEQVVLALRLTGADPAAAAAAAARRLGRHLAGRIGLTLVEPGLLDAARAAGIPAVGTVATATTSLSGLGPVAAVRGPYPPGPHTLEFCESRQVPYLCPDPRVLAAGRHTVALLEPAGRAEMERLWQAAGATTPPGAAPE